MLTLALTSKIDTMRLADIIVQALPILGIIKIKI